MKAKPPKPKRRTPSKQEAESLDLLPPEEVRRRTEDLLRTMLNTPPKPRTKPKKRAK